MKKARYQRGQKHSFNISDSQQFNNLIEKSKKIDPYCKIVSGKFKSIKVQKKILKVNINPYQSKELNIICQYGGWVQYYKIVCKSTILAHYLRLEPLRWN